MPRSSLFAVPIVLLCFVGLTLYYIVQWYVASNPFQSPEPFDSSAPESHGTSHVVSPPPARSRLNLTLASNVLRYQAVLRERQTAIQKIGGPNALACVPPYAGERRLNCASSRIPEPHTTSYSIWDLFAPAFSCPFPVYRVDAYNPVVLSSYVCFNPRLSGTMGDGGQQSRQTILMTMITRPSVNYRRIRLRSRARDPASELRGHGRGDQVQLRAGSIDTVTGLPGVRCVLRLTSSPVSA
jgi:hypothetical protein